jgi:hypothetical protein
MDWHKWSNRYSYDDEVVINITKEQGTHFHPTYVLIVRSGGVKWYEEHSPEERRAKIKNGNKWVGAQACEEVVEWIWDNHFAAIAGDAIGFDAWPPRLPIRRFSPIQSLICGRY